MKIGKIISIQQPQIHTKLNSQNNKKQNKKKKKDSDLSFEEVQNLMQHSSYKRTKGGAIRQVKFK